MLEEFITIALEAFTIVDEKIELKYMFENPAFIFCGMMPEALNNSKP
jgi:hypothetical protein